MERIWLRASGLTNAELALWIVVAAVAIEAATALLRFGLGLRAARQTRFLARWTGGLRVHHGYIGAALLICAPWLSSQGPRQATIFVGGALALSDALHHLLVLWPLTGSPEFDWRYPQGKEGPR
ncbi:MAG: hypothetical protein BWZ10_03468 [candidate division BRC1 bacterium ADurb.BinA364]|nr:MAG: hypothetical protein BWZ10_03468 [candidate division BRC1 bacterium ADurb.BinA364]